MNVKIAEFLREIYEEHKSVDLNYERTNSTPTIQQRKIKLHPFRIYSKETQELDI